MARCEGEEIEMPNPYPWLVILTKHPPRMNLVGYFPRKFTTKEAALATITWIETLDGKAELTATDFWIGDATMKAQQ
jgi:hypothetical protein